MRCTLKKDTANLKQVYLHGQFATRATVGRWQVFLRHLPGSLLCSKHQICLTVGSRTFGFQDILYQQVQLEYKNSMLIKSIHKHFVICRHTTPGILSHLQTSDTWMTKRLRISAGFCSKGVAYCWDPITLSMQYMMHTFQASTIPTTQNPPFTNYM